MRERIGMPRPLIQQAELAEAITTTHAALTSEEWNNAYTVGRDTAIDDALMKASAPTH
jgi:hypothetical protein